MKNKTLPKLDIKFLNIQLFFTTNYFSLLLITFLSMFAPLDCLEEICCRDK